MERFGVGQWLNHFRETMMWTYGVAYRAKIHLAHSHDSLARLPPYLYLHAATHYNIVKGPCRSVHPQL
jgi:hypothetical protein